MERKRNVEKGIVEENKSNLKSTKKNILIFFGFIFAILDYLTWFYFSKCFDFEERIFVFKAFRPLNLIYFCKPIFKNVSVDKFNEFSIWHVLARKILAIMARTR